MKIFSTPLCGIQICQGCGRVTVPSRATALDPRGKKENPPPVLSEHAFQEPKYAHAYCLDYYEAPKSHQKVGVRHNNRPCPPPFIPLPHPRCRILRKTIKNQSKSASIKETLPLGCTPQKKRCVKRCMSPVTQYNSEVWKSPLLNPEISAVERGIWGCHR